jgi:hypothetical protein
LFVVFLFLLRLFSNEQFVRYGKFIDPQNHGPWILGAHKFFCIPIQEALFYDKMDVMMIFSSFSRGQNTHRISHPTFISCEGKSKRLPHFFSSEYENSI